MPLLTTDRRHQLPCEAVYVYFDGHCASCHFVVKFLLRRRRCQRFRFIPLQTLVGSTLEQTIQRQFKLDLNSSLIVCKNGELYAQFSAVAVIFSELGWPWNLLLLLRLLPLSCLDFIYRLYARHRYQIAGRARDPEICRLLNAEERALFPQPGPSGQAIFAPRPRVFLSAQWRQLIMVNYRVPAELLQAYLPAATELDDWQGEMLVSLVGFAFTGTSLQGMSLPIHSDFEEVNLRFYVRRAVVENGVRTWRRGVVFIREIVPFKLIAQTANIFYGERYTALTMDHELSDENGRQTLRYSWSDHSGICAISGTFQGEPKPLVKGSLAEFICEHYFGYAKKARVSSTEYEVEHPAWRVWPEPKIQVSGAIAKHYPAAFAPYLSEVHSVVLAEGSAVRVFRGQTIAVSPD